MTVENKKINNKKTMILGYDSRDYEPQTRGTNITIKADTNKILIKFNGKPNFAMFFALT